MRMYDEMDEGISRLATFSPRRNSFIRSMVNFSDIEDAVHKAFKFNNSKVQKELDKLTDALVKAGLLDWNDVGDEEAIHYAIGEAQRKPGSRANSAIDYFIRFAKKEFNLGENLMQEAYERGFQNGFSMALDEKDSDTFETNLLRYNKASDALASYVSAFLVFRNEPVVYSFLEKVYKKFLAPWSLRTLDQTCRYLNKNTYTKDLDKDSYKNLNLDTKTRDVYYDAYIYLIGDFLMNHNNSDDPSDWTDRTVGEIRKLIGEAKVLFQRIEHDKE